MVIEVSAIDVASTILRRPGGAGRDGAVLLVAGKRAIERDDVGRGVGAAFELRLGAADFGGAGQKRQQRARLGAHRARDRVGHLRLDRPRVAAEHSASRPGKARPSLAITGASPSNLGHARAVDGRRHDEEPQILAQALLHVARQREAEIGIERALVEFVEQHRGDAVEHRIVEDEPGENRLR